MEIQELIDAAGKVPELMKKLQSLSEEMTFLKVTVLSNTLFSVESICELMGFKEHAARAFMKKAGGTQKVGKYLFINGSSLFAYLKENRNLDRAEIERRANEIIRKNNKHLSFKYPRKAG